MDNRANVRIRGTSEGLVITVRDGAWSDVLAELDARLGQKPEFFRGGRVSVAVGNRQLTQEHIQALGELLSRYDVTLWAVWSESETTQREVAELGLETGLGDFRSSAETVADVDSELRHAIIVVGPIRSGKRIQHEGSVVILGDVHPGAEVIAGGHVIVWGQLRGIAHAGAGGRDEALVCALVFMPTQVRIGHLLARGDGESTPEGPEMARIIGNQIVVEPWTRWRHWVGLSDEPIG